MAKAQRHPASHRNADVRDCKCLRCGTLFRAYDMRGDYCKWCITEIRKEGGNAS